MKRFDCFPHCKGTEYFKDILRAASIEQIVTLKSGGEARRQLLERDFDLVIINAPLRDESGKIWQDRLLSRGSHR